MLVPAQKVTRYLLCTNHPLPASPRLKLVCAKQGLCYYTFVGSRQAVSRFCKRLLSTHADTYFGILAAPDRFSRPLSAAKKAFLVAKRQQRSNLQWFDALADSTEYQPRYALS
jgi:hypothetical protein